MPKTLSEIKAVFNNIIKEGISDDPIYKTCFSELDVNQSAFSNDIVNKIREELNKLPRPEWLNTSEVLSDKKLKLVYTYHFPNKNFTLNFEFIFTDKYPAENITIHITDITKYLPSWTDKNYNYTNLVQDKIGGEMEIKDLSAAIIDYLVEKHHLLRKGALVVQHYEKELSNCFGNGYKKYYSYRKPDYVAYKAKLTSPLSNNRYLIVVLAKGFPIDPPELIISAGSGKSKVIDQRTYKSIWCKKYDIKKYIYYIIKNAKDN